MIHNMRTWSENLINSTQRKAMPILGYVGTNLINEDIFTILQNGSIHFKCIRSVFQRYPSAALMTCMDLSVEAEAFGCLVNFNKHDLPIVLNGVIEDFHDISFLALPSVTAGRISEFIEAAFLTSRCFSPIPTFASMVGPFSLAGRLFHKSVTTFAILTHLEETHDLLDKCTRFLIEYAQAFKAAGASGLIIYEPFAEQFTAERYGDLCARYVRKISDEVQDDSFYVILSDSSGSIDRIPSLVFTNCKGFLFSCGMDLSRVLPLLPANVLAFGNVPYSLLRHSTPKEVISHVGALLAKTKAYPNFVLSTDNAVHADTPADNIDAFYSALDRFNDNSSADAIA